MDVVAGWTGRTACLLQEAFRDTQEAFAGRLGISTRSVARWHRDPNMVPGPERQQLLDVVLTQAPGEVRTRFELLVGTKQRQLDGARELRVAIAVVVRDESVLLVCRRDGDGPGWQFPAGMVKPGADSRAIATQETLAETGIRCSIREHLGARLHPVTNVWCDYYLADYLAGEPENRDPVENTDVLWSRVTDLHRFIEPGRVFHPVLEALEDLRDPVH
ncbi:NUDIX hydrolase [Amycolatopsis sp. NPDC004368]